MWTPPEDMIDAAWWGEAPALVFAAELDLLVPAEAVRSLGKAIVANCITLQNTGHGIPLNPVWIEAAVAIDERLTATQQ